MARPFSEVFAYTQKIYGAFSNNEAEALYNCAVECGNNANFVEIGCYAGKSSSVLALVAKDNDCSFFTVDIFMTGLPSGKDVKSEFTYNMIMTGGKYRLFEMKSIDAASSWEDRKQNGINLLFIDGDHTYEGVTLDLKSWHKYVVPNGFILLHDYSSSWEGVKMATDEFLSSYKNFYMLSTADSMIILKRKGE